MVIFGRFYYERKRLIRKLENKNCRVVFHGVLSTSDITGWVDFCLEETGLDLLQFGIAEGGGRTLSF